MYCTDAPLAEYLRSRIGVTTSAARGSTAFVAQAASVSTPSNVIPLRQATKVDRDSGLPSVPVIELRIAAGSFSGPQALEESAETWVALPDWIRPQPGLFVAQVVGESMNRRIPNGSWCLFRANPTGTREGKVVVVQHRSIADPETGGRYTIKRYTSEKIPSDEGGWSHLRITLHPDSDQPRFQPIVLTIEDAHEDFRVIAELLMVLPTTAA